jgi:hypothetical protein
MDFCFTCVIVFHNFILMNGYYGKSHPRVRIRHLPAGRQVFIIYRQKDNKHDGWVTELVDNLKGELEYQNTSFIIWSAQFESPRAHSPLLAAESASIKNLP